MKIKAFLFVGTILVLIFNFSSIQAQDSISECDRLYTEIQDMIAAKKLFSNYLNLLPTAENKYEVYWRLARIHYLIGIYSEDKKEQKTVFSQGIYYGKKAVNLEPEKPDGYYWLGVNYGKYGEVKGVLKSLSLVNPIKDAMNKVIELDPTYEDGGAYKVLGRVYFKLPGFAGGSKEKSLEHLLKSKELDSNDALTRLYVADTYLALKRIDESREELEYIMNMPDDPRWIYQVEQCKEGAKRMLRKKEFRKK